MSFDKCSLVLGFKAHCSDSGAAHAQKFQNENRTSGAINSHHEAVKPNLREYQADSQNCTHQTSLCGCAMWIWNMVQFLEDQLIH